MEDRTKRNLLVKESRANSPKASRDKAAVILGTRRPTIREVIPDPSPDGEAPEEWSSPGTLSPRESNGTQGTGQNGKSAGGRTLPVPPDPDDSFRHGSNRLRARPRNRTLEDISWDKSSPMVTPKSRPRVRSMHSADPSTLYDPSTWAKAPSPDVPPVLPRSLTVANFQTSSPSREGSGFGGHRLGFTKSPPHIGSPGRSPNAAAGSLRSPIRISNPRNVLRMMKGTCGRMRGYLEFRTHEADEWSSGHCFIDEETGGLLQNPNGPGEAQRTLLPDLRCCQVKSYSDTDLHHDHLIVSSPCSGVVIHLRPLSSAELDRWLAALLCWQPLRPKGAKGKMTTVPQLSLLVERRPWDRRRSSDSSAKDTAIVKVGKVLLLHQPGRREAGAYHRRNASVDRNYDPDQHSWQKVSCVLRENGEFKLVTETDVSLVSAIQLSQLSRCAVQGLEHSVLEEDFCIAIYPRIAGTSTTPTLALPIYISLETRVLYEVWLVLLRAFCVPEMYGPLVPDDDGTLQGTAQVNGSLTRDMFRVERMLSVRIVEARIKSPRPRTLPESSPRLRTAREDPSIGSYRAEVFLDGELRARTASKADTSNPFWREDFDFADLPGSLASVTVLLKKRPADWNHHAVLTGLLEAEMPTFPDVVGPGDVDHQHVHGKIDIDFANLDKGDTRETWWTLGDGVQESSGDMLLRVRTEQLVVLMASDYQPISELLHRAYRTLPSKIAEALPTKLQRVSEVLLNIFQVSGLASGWLMALIENEIESIPVTMPSRPAHNRRQGSNGGKEVEGDDRLSTADTEANLLFRGNTLLTKALEHHMKRIGKGYLEETLCEALKEIEESNLDCEVDPNRLSSTLDLERNWRHLVKLFRLIWSFIHASALRCPRELRLVLRHVRTCAEKRWGRFRSSVSYSSVSGFLFLRFFCPAVLNPKLFGLLKDHPQPRTQRALTLVAKSLQGLANMSTFGTKESWMEPMNHFLSSRRQEFKDFIDLICAVEVDPTHAPPAIHPSYATPITILARLPPASREGFPSLPHLIDQPRAFATLIHLWLDSPPPLSLTLEEDGELHRFHAQCLSVRTRTAFCLAQAEEAPRPTTALLPRWEEIVSRIDGWPKHAHGAVPPSPSSPDAVAGPDSSDRDGSDDEQHPPKSRGPVPGTRQLRRRERPDKPLELRSLASMQPGREPPPLSPTANLTSTTKDKDKDRHEKEHASGKHKFSVFRKRTK
ncbi:MAG: hypothetical protein M1832_004740 [Thelocarpon impressellum]|nr:MAG: hypothetical protein M1832_004740 [Thelocarpon impressellum]